MKKKPQQTDIPIIELEEQLLKLKLAYVDKDWTSVSEVLEWFENEGYINYNE
tara:strand:- start:44 stop:199 length:156 start_codon:yes stop_codon:yes gene_type:complete